MHRSRLGSIIIDCEDPEACARFWGGALGVEPRPVGEDGVYIGLIAPGGRTIFVQRVPEHKTAKTRMHVDIETDNINAEVRRLEVLGATRKEDQGKLWVMQDPCGNEFCVLGTMTEGFPERAQTWEP
jgi:hypothetical protein